MRLQDILKEDTQVKFGSAILNPVTREHTQMFLDNELYVDQEGKMFKKQWTNPEQHFKGGGIFAVAYDIENNPVAVGVIRLPEEILKGELDGREIIYLGSLGFYTKDEYRGYGLASALAHRIESKVLSAFDIGDATPVVMCSGKGCVVAKNFKRIQTEN